MRVQPHLPSRPFTAIVTCSCGAARLAWSAAKRPAPPEPRTRMSVRMRFMLGKLDSTASPAAARCARSGARLQHPEPRDVRRPVVAAHGLEGLHRAILVSRMELRFTEEELRVLGALEA